MYQYLKRTLITIQYTQVARFNREQKSSNHYGRVVIIGLVKES